MSVINSNEEDISDSILPLIPIYSTSILSPRVPSRFRSKAILNINYWINLEVTYSYIISFLWRIKFDYLLILLILYIPKSTWYIIGNCTIFHFMFIVLPLGWCKIIKFLNLGERRFFCEGNFWWKDLYLYIKTQGLFQ